DFLRSMILNEFNDMLGDVHTSILEIQSMTREIADATRSALASDFTRLGLDLVSFQISAITPPEEVQQRIDERSGMGAIGNMGAYTQYKTAQAIGDAARAEGGGGDAASTGVGLGAGLGIGQAMAGAIGSAYQQSQQGQQQQGQQMATRQCPNCNSTIPANAKFCPECGTSLAETVCPECGTANQPGAKFCTNCGTRLE
ncbi:MAG TPA: zinc-ribbon domain-containing protein, partial [Thermomicrobiales bacterium]|nr:zinc-ribbon domain-containing protein [Thermomicrobiales bacterium]